MHKIEEILFMQVHTRLLLKRSHTSPACGHAYSMCYNTNPTADCKSAPTSQATSGYRTLPYSSVETCLHTLLACSLHSSLCSYGQHHKQEGMRNDPQQWHTFCTSSVATTPATTPRSTFAAQVVLGLTMRRRTHARHKPAVLSLMPSAGQLSNLFPLNKTAQQHTRSVQARAPEQCLDPTIQGTRGMLAQRQQATPALHTHRRQGAYPANIGGHRAPLLLVAVPNAARVAAHLCCWLMKD
jgi:hypothetical protein